MKDSGRKERRGRRGKKGEGERRVRVRQELGPPIITTNRSLCAAPAFILFYFIADVSTAAIK